MGYRCPYCNQVCYDNGKITKDIYESFSGSGISFAVDHPDESLELSLSMCPNCGKIKVFLRPYWNNKSMKFSFYYPASEAISLPDYIPNAICNDYMEAVSIVDLSPKAAATLARRCLQGMIHDFWGIKEKNLNAEITALRGKIPAAQWSAIDALRKVGNIGAHMEKDIGLIIDVDADEAKALIKLIELLIDKWYIARHDEQMLFAEIEAISKQKEGERKSLAAPPSGQ